MSTRLVNQPLMTKVKENDRREQIEYEPQLLLTYTSPDQPEMKMKYQYPVISFKCNHLMNCFDLEQVKLGLKEFGSFKCPSQGCNSIIKSEEELIKDIRWYANEEFHELVQEAMVIEGKLFNRYYRIKTYTEQLNDKQIRSYIINMMSRFVERDSSINSLIWESLQSSELSKSIHSTGSEQIISFWAICLLDKVKITIPVRIIGCKHKECYDITSLLVYQKENASEKIFYCAAEGCSQKLEISNVKTMVSQLVIDLHLLAALKQSLPSAFKFIFNPNIFRIECDVQRKDGVIIDPAIYECFRKRKLSDNQEIVMSEYQKFEKQVQQQITNILQQSVTKEIEKKLRLQRYQVAQINMQDKFTGYTVEYPVRCKHTDNFNSSNDLRSVIADFVYDKINNQAITTMYVCKLCYKEQNSPLVSVQIKNQLYLDQNLFSRMFKDMAYLHTKVFNYDGKTYMRQEFFDKQKIKTAEFIESLKQNNGNLIVEFKNLYCAKDINVPLQMPLLIKQCQMQSIIDFDTFYNEMQKIQFDLESSAGIIFCQCDNCKEFPIKQIKGNLYYHEAFGQALTQFRKTGSKDQSFFYNFSQNSIQQKGEVPKISGWIDSLAFSNSFKQKNVQGKKYQLISMNQTIHNGLNIIHDEKGVHGNLDEFLERMNNDINQSPQLRKYRFVVISISLTFKSEVIKINIGKIKYTQSY